MFSANVDELVQVEDIGPQSAIFIKTVFDMHNRLLRDDERTSYTMYEEIGELFLKRYKHIEAETMMLFLFDKKGRISREAIIAMGNSDDAIFMSCSAPTENVKACGFDAVYAYHWGTQGYSPEYTKSRITSQIEKGLLHVIPTVSAGFNSIGWNGRRTPLLSTAGMGELFSWIKEEVLPENEGEDWKKKFVMLSTWNEYGEGL